MKILRYLEVIFGYENLKSEQIKKSVDYKDPDISDLDFNNAYKNGVDFDEIAGIALSRPNQIIEDDSIFTVLNQDDGYSSFGYKEFRNLYLEKYLKKNLNVLKNLLTNTSLEELNGKYSFLLEMYCDILGLEFDLIEQNNNGIVFYTFKNGKKYISREMSYSNFIVDMKVEILEGLGMIKRKSYKELIAESEFSRLTNKGNPEYEPIDEYAESGAYGYAADIDLEEQTDVFLNNLTKITFSEKDEKFLKELFNKFSKSEFISIRSSANVEDGGKYNYPGIFYTGFCSTKDFESFKKEVKLVLESAKSQELNDYQEQNGLSDNVFMGIEVMEVVGDYYNDVAFNSPRIDYDMGEMGIEHIKKNGEKEYLFYPDGGGVVTTKGLCDDTFVRIRGVKGMPTSVTSNTNQSILSDIAKGTGKILSYENQPGNFCYYKQTGVAGIDNDGEIQYHLKSLHEKEHCLKGNIKEDIAYSEQSYKGHRGCDFLPFSLNQYASISDIYTKLEEKYGNKLELEFVVHDDIIYIIQSRKITSNFEKAENMEKPNELLVKKMFLSQNDVETSMGYISNEELDIINIESDTEDYNGGGGKYGREHFTIEQIKNKEMWANSGYIITIKSLSDFPFINKEDFPNLRLIVFKGMKGLGTHALMRIRELGIPVILLKDDSKIKIKSLKGKAKVYINGSKEAMIYDN